MNENKQLKVKDLVNIGVFSALYMVISMIAMLPAGIAPIIWIMWPGLAGIICGVFYTMLMVKVRKAGTALILSLITGILYFATGECTWVIVATCAVGGILAELSRKVFGYQTFKGIAVSGGLTAVGLIGSPLPMWLFQESYMKSIIEMGMAEDYVARLQAMTSVPTLIGMIIFAFVGGLLGTMIGHRMMKKHFRKAGIV